MKCCNQTMIRGQIEHLAAGYTWTCEVCGKQKSERLIDLSVQHSPFPFQALFRDRGHGHGDYVVADADGRPVAEMLTIYQMREAVLLAAAPQMYEFLLVQYECARDPEILAILEDAGYEASTPEGQDTSCETVDR